jgi:hypothetical protein
MKVVIDRYPEIIDNAVEAIRAPAWKPVRSSIRGGTDGSRLSFMGLPCPNIFAGGHAFHSPLEWVSRQDMEKAVKTIVELARAAAVRLDAASQDLGSSPPQSGGEVAAKRPGEGGMDRRHRCPPSPSWGGIEGGGSRRIAPHPLTGSG